MGAEQNVLNGKGINLHHSYLPMKKAPFVNCITEKKNKQNKCSAMKTYKMSHDKVQWVFVGWEWDWTSSSSSW